MLGRGCDDLVDRPPLFHFDEVIIVRVVPACVRVYMYVDRHTLLHCCSLVRSVGVCVRVDVRRSVRQYREPTRSVWSWMVLHSLTLPGSPIAATRVCTIFLSFFSLMCRRPVAHSIKNPTCSPTSRIGFPRASTNNASLNFEQLYAVCSRSALKRLALVCHPSPPTATRNTASKSESTGRELREGLGTGKPCSGAQHFQMRCILDLRVWECYVFAMCVWVVRVGCACGLCVWAVCMLCVRAVWVVCACCVHVTCVRIVYVVCGLGVGCVLCV